KQDYLTTLPLLDGLHKQHGKLNYVIELVRFHGWTPPAVVQEVKFDLGHARQFGRIAIVGEAKRQGIPARIGGFFFPGEVKFFNPGELAPAGEWAKAASAAPVA
ncbi:MAG: STAS/SEC14 domain-containing protein, partial [Opitutaceae bacterium]